MKEIFGFEWSFDLSASIITSIIIFVLLSVLFIVMGAIFSHMDPKKDKIPDKGLKFLIVVLVDTINKFVEKNLGKENRKTYAPTFLALASFITLANLSALFGLNPPFANLGVALTLSVVAFVIFQFTGLKYQGLKNRIDGFLGPVKGVSFLVFPISIIGEITTPFSMGMRMFGNLFSGIVIGGIVFGVCDALGAILGNALATVFVTSLIHPIFDAFFGALQMYVYVMLLTMFIKQNM